MTISDGLRAHLLADASIAALVATRIYPLRLPQKVPTPLTGAIVLQRISSIRWAHLRGQGALARPRFQVDSWAQTYDGAVALGTLVRSRLEGYQGTWSDGSSPPVELSVTVLFQSEADMFEEEVQGGLCRHTADYFIFHSTNGGQV